MKIFKIEYVVIGFLILMVLFFIVQVSKDTFTIDDFILVLITGILILLYKVYFVVNKLYLIRNIDAGSTQIHGIYSNKHYAKQEMQDLILKINKSIEQKKGFEMPLLPINNDTSTSFVSFENNLRIIEISAFKLNKSYLNE